MSNLDQREVRMMHQIANERQITPGAFFQPNGAQERVIRAIGEWNWEKTRIRTIVCGFANGVGKTAVASNVVNSIVNGPACRWLDYPIFRNWPFSRNLRVLGTTQNVKPGGAVDEELQKWLNRDSYSKQKMGKDYWSVYDFNSGFKLNVFSANQEAREMEGATCGFIWIDEPVALDQYQANMTRLRDGGGLVLITATLVGQHSDWIEEVLINHEDGDKIIVLFADVEENCREHGVRGLRDHAEIEAMYEQMRGDPDEAQVRMGKSLSLAQAGKMFRTFRHRTSDAVHVQPIDSFPRLNRCTLYHAVDPHSDRPWAMLWFAVDENDTYWFVEEWPNQRTHARPYHQMGSVTYGLSEYYDAIVATEARLKITGLVAERFIDGRFAQQPQLADPEKRTLADLMADEYQMYFELSSRHPSSRERARSVVADLLAFDEDRFQAGSVSSRYSPHFFVADRCTNLIRAMQRHAFKRNMEAHTRRAQYNQEGKTFKDFVDVVFIGVESLPGYRGVRNRRQRQRTTADFRQTGRPVKI